MPQTLSSNRKAGKGFFFFSLTQKVIYFNSSLGYMDEESAVYLSATLWQELREADSWVFMQSLLKAGALLRPFQRRNQASPQPLTSV